MSDAFKQSGSSPTAAKTPARLTILLRVVIPSSSPRVIPVEVRSVNYLQDERHPLRDEEA